MAYKLYYFQIRGRAEQVRLLLHALELDFEDIAVKREQLLELKAEGPATLYFGSLPMLEDGNFRLCQGPTILSYLAGQHGAKPSDPQLSAKADAIAWGAEDLRMRYFKLFGDDKDKAQADFLSGDWQTRWLPSLNGLLEFNGNTGYFVGQQLTHADIAVWDVIDAVLNYIPASNLDGYSAVQRFYAGVGNRPPIAAYVASRPE